MLPTTDVYFLSKTQVIVNIMTISCIAFDNFYEN